MAQPHPVVVPLDDAARAHCEAVGLQLQRPEASLREVDALVCTRDGLARLVDWRTAGHTTPALVLDAPVPPAALPATATTAEKLAEAASSLARGRPLHRLVLPTGVADLRTLRLQATDGTSVRLSQREADLLAYLARHAHREVPRAEVQTEVFGHARAAANTRAVDMAVSRLRKKIEADPAAPEVLLTSRGGGYRLALPQPDPEGLVGRRSELAQLRRLLHGPVLVTLKGPPGVGKTRLAEVIAAERGGQLVRLDAVRTGDQLVVGVAAQLAVAAGLEPEDVPPMERILAGLEQLRPPLLVLDNAEHVLDGVRTLAAALHDSDLGLPVLVTSQRALDLTPEQVVELAPLDRDAARALFLARTRTPPSAEHLDAIVTALDGLPLAIELASQWGEVVPWPEVPALLDTDDPSLPARLQQAWSLLPPDAQRVLEALAAFADRVPFADLQQVAQPAAVGLRRLLASSLAHRRGDDVRLLAPVRRWVRAHGPRRAQADAAHHRHMASLAEAAIAELPTGRGPVARRQLAERLADLDRAYAFAPDGWLALALEVVHRAHGRPDQRRAIVEHAFAHEQRPNPRVALAIARLDLHPAQQLGALADDLDAAQHPDADPQWLARAKVSAVWARYRTAPNPVHADEALAYARQAEAADAERMAEYQVSIYRARHDAAYLRTSLALGERIVGELRALEAYPFALRVASSVASTWASLGNPARAEVALNTLAELVEAWPDAIYEGSLHNLRAYQALDEGDTAGALEAFDAMRAVRFGRRGAPDAVWLKNRAMVLLDAGRSAEAERDLEVSVDKLEGIPHMFVTAVALLAIARLDLARVADAEQALQRVTDLGEVTALAEAYYQETVAMVHALAGRVDAARAVHDALDPDALGPQSAAVMWAMRAALGHPEARARAEAFADDTVVARSLAQLFAALDEPRPAEALARFLDTEPPAPVLVRVAARIAADQFPDS